MSDTSHLDAPASSRPGDLPALSRRRAALLFRDESGAATAEYAIATMAAVAFAGLLVVIKGAERTKSPSECGWSPWRRRQPA